MNINIDLNDLFSDAENKQKKLLIDIMRSSADSEWGRKYKFDEITSIEDFRSRVPVTEFEQYKTDIERLKKGKKDILYPGDTVMFLASSGSTGIPKYIPESAKGAEAKKKVSDIRRYAKMLLFPQLLEPGVKILALSNPSVYEKTEGCIPVGSASGVAAAGSDSQELKMLAIPAQLLAVGNIDASTREYLMALFAAYEKNIQGIICNNPAHIEKLLTLINDKSELIAKDIEKGQISVELESNLKTTLENSLTADTNRSNMLREIINTKGSIHASDLWPDFKVLSCWTSGSVGRVLKTVRAQLPANAAFLDCGYGASEGKFNIPVEKNSSYGLPALFGYFFEFLPLDGGKPLCLWEVEEGKSYELIITSYSGLYRYNMHDIVTIGPKWAGTNQIVFSCKSTDSLTCGENKLYAHELYALTEKFERDNSCTVKFLELCHYNDELVLNVEPGDMCNNARGYIEFMRECLDKQYNIRLTGGWIVKDGYRNSLFTRELKSGKTVNQTKLATFVNRLCDEDFVEEKVF